MQARVSRPGFEYQVSFLYDPGEPEAPLVKFV